MKFINIKLLGLLQLIWLIIACTNIHSNSPSDVSGTGPTTNIQNNQPNFTDFVRKNDWSGAISALEYAWKKAYEDYYNIKRGSINFTTPAEISAVLEQLNQKSGQKSALVYLRPTKTQLEILLLIPGRTPIYKQISDAAQEKLNKVTQAFYSSVTDPSVIIDSHTDANDVSYLQSAQQLLPFPVK